MAMKKICPKCGTKLDYIYGGSDGFEITQTSSSTFSVKETFYQGGGYSCPKCNYVGEGLEVSEILGLSSQQVKKLEKTYKPIAIILTMISIALFVVGIVMLNIKGDGLFVLMPLSGIVLLSVALVLFHKNQKVSKEKPCKKGFPVKELIIGILLVAFVAFIVIVSIIAVVEKSKRGLL